MKAEIREAVARSLVRPLRRLMRERFPLIYRDGTRYDRIVAEIGRRKPRRLLEIGVCRGESAERMIRAALSASSEKIEYFGFDLFEGLTPELLEKEASRRPLVQAEVQAFLEGIEVRGRRAAVRLVGGFSIETLPRLAAELAPMDLLFIDGGHSYETVLSDWTWCRKLAAPGAVIFFDDYPNWGIPRVLGEIDRREWVVDILEPGDIYRHVDPPLRCQLARVARKT